MTISFQNGCSKAAVAEWLNVKTENVPLVHVMNSLKNQAALDRRGGAADLGQLMKIVVRSAMILQRECNAVTSPKVLLIATRITTSAGVSSPGFAGSHPAACKRSICKKVTRLAKSHPFYVKTQCKAALHQEFTAPVQERTSFMSKFAAFW